MGRRQKFGWMRMRVVPVVAAAFVCWLANADTGAAGVSGTVTYTGSQTGQIWLVAAPYSNVWNRVLSLDGYSSMSVGPEPSLSWTGSRTIAMWIRPDQSAWSSLFDLGYESGRLGTDYSGYLTYEQGDWMNHWQRTLYWTSIQTGIWTHVAVVLNQEAGVLQWYVNGWQTYSEALPISSPGYIWGLTVGSGFSGMMDEVTLVNRACTDSDIWSMYYYGMDPYTYDLAGCWRFDDGTGSGNSWGGMTGSFQGNATTTQRLDVVVRNMMLPGFGSYSWNDVPFWSCWLAAYLDVNGNGTFDDSEPWGTYPNNPCNPYYSPSGLDIVLSGGEADTNGPSVVAVDPTGSVLRAAVCLDVEFDEPVSASSLGTDDVAITGPNGAVTVTNVLRVTPNRARFTFAPQTSPGVYLLEVGSNITDLSGNSMVGTYTNSFEVRLRTISGTVTYNGPQTGVVWVAAAPTSNVWNRALSLDGSSGYVSLDNSGLLPWTNSQTIAMWVKPDGTGSGVLLAKNWYYEGALYYDSSYGLRYFYGNGVDYRDFFLGRTVATGQWTHVALVRDMAAKELRWYENGVLVNETSANVVPAASTYAVTIGGNGGDNFRGQMDEVVIWNVACDEVQIRNAMEGCLTGTESGLLGNWRFDTGTAEDSSTNGQHGRFVGNAATTQQSDVVARRVRIDGPGSYALSGIPEWPQCWVAAHLDYDANGVVDAWDAKATYPANPITATGNVSGVNMTLSVPDTAAPVVTWIEPTGVRLSPTSYVDVWFNEAIRTASLETIRLVGPLGAVDVTNVTAISTNCVRFAFAAQNKAGIYAMEVGPGIADMSGNPMTGVYTNGFEVRVGTISGTISYVGSQTGAIWVVASPQSNVWNRTFLCQGGSFISLGSPASLQWTNSQTIAMWVRPSESNSTMGLCVKYSREWQMRIEGAGVPAYYYGNGSQEQAFPMGRSLEAGSWTHLALVRDMQARRLRWYANGELVAETNALYVPAASISSMYLGRDYWGYYYRGEMDDVVMLNSACTGSQIQRVMNGAVATNEAGLVGFWRFDAGLGVDSSTNKLNGTVVGGIGSPQRLDVVVRSVTMAGPGQYTLADVPMWTQCWVGAFVDYDPNGALDAWEAKSIYVANPIAVTGDVVGVNMTLSVADTGAPTTTGMDPTGTCFGTVSYVDALFSEAIRAASVDIGDVRIVGPNGVVAVTNVSMPFVDRVRFSFVPQTASGVYSVEVGPAIADLSGNTVSGVYTNTFEVRLGAISGTVSYGGAQTGTIWVVASPQSNVWNRAFAFPGSPYVSLGNPASLRGTNSATIAMWIRPLGNNVALYGKSGSQEGAMGIDSSWHPTYMYGNGSQMQTFTMDRTVQSGQWTHLALVRDMQAQRLRWYLNGALVTETNTLYAPAASSSTAYLGYSASFSYRYSGDMDEVAILNTACTIGQIRRVMTGSLIGNEAGLAGLWRFDTGTAADSSTNRVDGTIGGGSIVATQRLDVLVQRVPLGVPGSYTLPNIPGWNPCWVRAFRDSTANGIPDTWEPYGACEANPLCATGVVTGVDVVLGDPDATGPRVIRHSPTGVTNRPVSSVDFVFSERIDTQSVGTQVVALLAGPTGILSVASVTLVGTNVCRVQFATQSCDGLYRCRIGPGVRDPAANPMDQDANGINGQTTDVYTAEWTLMVGPRVVAHSPSGTVGTGESAVTLDFDEPIDAATFGTNDVQVTSGSSRLQVTGVAQVTPTRFAVGLSVPAVCGLYRFAVGPDINDLSGNKLDQNGDGVAGATADRYTVSLIVTNADVVFHIDTTLGTNDFAYEDRNILVDGATLTVDGVHRFSSLQLINGAVVTHTAGETNGLQVKAGTIAIAAGCRIDATARGDGPSMGGVK